MKIPAAAVLLFALSVPVRAEAQDRAYFRESLLFFASFDRSTDADFARGKARPVKASDPKPAQGKFGGAILLESGAKSFVEYEANENIRSDRGTIAFYFKPKWSGGDYQQRFFFFYPGIGNPHGGVNAPDTMGIHTMRYQTPAQQLWLWYDDHGGGNNIVRSPIAAWSPGTWYHVAVTWDAEWLSMYLDGELTGRSRVDGQITAPDKTFFVGSSRNGYAPVDGTMDELYIYGRALSAAEIGLLTGQPRLVAPRIQSVRLQQELFFRNELRIIFRCELAGRIDAAEHRLHAVLLPEGADNPVASAEYRAQTASDVLSLPHAVAEGSYLLKLRLVDREGGAIDEKSAPLRVIAGPFDQDVP